MHLSREYLMIKVVLLLLVEVRRIKMTLQCCGFLSIPGSTIHVPSYTTGISSSECDLNS